MKTTYKVRYLALYASSCCMDEVLFDVNDRFSHCPRCARLCSWNLVERVISWKEMDEFAFDFASETEPKAA